MNRDPRPARWPAVLLTLGIAVLVLSGCAGAMSQLQNSYVAQRAYEAGLDQYRAEDYASAIQQFERALALEASHDDARAYLAWSYYHTGAYVAATRQCRLTLERTAEWPGPYDGLGWSRFRVEHYRLALEAFNRALALDPQYRDARVGRAYTLFALGRYQEARPELRALLREGRGVGFLAGSDVEPIRARYAWTLFYLGDYPAALQEFSRGIAARPEWAGLHNGLGWSYLRLGDRVHARQSFQRALELRADLNDSQAGLRLAMQPSRGRQGVSLVSE